jgi:glycosyltransferase involved in cell wall biosynthesis
MRICIPIEFRPQGGGFYFLQTLVSFFENEGWTVVSDVKEPHDILFTNHWMTPLSEIYKAIRRSPKVRVVQRIDGSAQDYGRDPEADGRQRAVNQLADLTIFQSQYARFATREKFPVIAKDGPVIYNPVDLAVFNPAGSKRLLSGDRRVICVSWSTNPMKGADQIYRVAANNKDLNFALCGNYKDAPPLANIELLGVLDRAELAATLRSGNVLLTFSKNEACPNHVLEALASGLPVLYDNSGAAAEVVGPAGIAVTVETFRNQFEAVQVSADNYACAARQRAESMFDPKLVLRRYVNELQALKPKLDLARSLRAWAAVGS